MSASTAPTLPAARAGRSRLRNELLPLYRRSLRVTLRVPSAVVPSLFIPVFFLVVNTAALNNISQLPVFEDANYVSFFLPVALLLSVASAGSGSGLSLVTDIDAGYFDKLLLAPISRTSLLLSRLMVDGTRAAMQALIVLVVGIAIGADIATGVAGALLLVVMAFAFGLAYAGISLTIALRTGSPEATQASFIVFFPLVFLSPTFVPIEFLTPWLGDVALFNPVTYVMQGMRALTVDGFVWSDIAFGFAAIAGIGLVTLGSAFRALAGRASQ